jgi:adenine-specific DNA-methyltransferase
MPFEINKTELVWPGKYDADGNPVQAPRVSLPFQVIERVNETRATREAKKAEGLTLFDVWDGANEGATFEEGWRNKLIWGDNFLVVSSLLERFRGQLQTIYIDPPFAADADFSMKVAVGVDNEVTKAASVLEETAYRDTWGNGYASYLSMLYIRLQVIRELLTDSGSIFVHLDSRMVSHARVLMDEVFGNDNFVNEIIWSYSTSGRPEDRFPEKHDNILWFRKSGAHSFYPDQVKVPYSKEYIASHFRDFDENGRPCRKRFDAGKWRTYYPDDGMLPNAVWDIPYVNSQAKDRTGYPTQKPVELIERLILATTKKGDIVADLFVGSGTTAVVAENLERRWIVCDLGRYSIHTTRKRMLEIAKCKPFEVLNLGSYERQFWSTANFGKDLDGDGQINLLEYIAFILRLYGAEPLTGSSHLHGRKGDAYVYVGAVSNPVTIAEIEQAVNECKSMKGSTVHVLGWEWEMGLHDPIVGEAKRLGVKLVLRQIPREVMEAEAVRKGQIKFFELAYLDVELQQKPNGEAVCTLNDFSTPNTDFIPEEVREEIKKWSDYVDYWAVDWDFQNDTFNHGFVTYRTRQDRTLQLKSDSHKYNKAGTYKVMIKAIDIFGNDTSKLVEFKVK